MNEEEETFIKQQFMSSFPAVEVSNKHYSLEADIATGWRPRSKILGPIPFNCDNKIVDEIIDQLTSFGRKYQMRVIYLGYRYLSSFKMQAQMKKNYNFKHEAVINENFSHLGAYFRKFHANFKSKYTRLFKGMNPTIKKDEQIIFDSNFESGNLDAAIRVKQNEYDLFMRVDTNTRGHIQWFNFIVRNTGKKKVKFNIVNFRKNKTLYSRGMKPYFKSEHLFQSKNIGWTQGGRNVKYQKKKLRYSFMDQYYYEQLLTFNCLSFEYIFQTDWEEVQFAYCPPFTYSDNINMINTLKKNSMLYAQRQINSQTNIQIDENNNRSQQKNQQSTLKQKADYEFLKEEVLCQSLGGLEIPLLTITDYTIQEKHKKCMLISGRIHPGETNGSYMMKGFLDFICGTTQQALQLRKAIIFKVVPMLNPDGVTAGNFRTSLCGRDLNRAFKNNFDMLIPEVKAIKQLVFKLKKQYRNRLIFFLDFHGHSVKKNVFLYGPEYQIWETNYYKTRIFPKILSAKTQLFRYYSCLFRIADFKRTTGRAVILKNVPHCYTIEASTGFYYTTQGKKDVPFDPESWIFMGKTMGQGIKQYMDLMYDQEMTKQQRRQKMNDLKGSKYRNQSRKKEKAINKSDIPTKFQNRVNSNSLHQNPSVNPNNNYENVLGNLSKKARDFIEMIKLDEEKNKQMQLENKQEDQGHESDKFSEGGSDSESAQDDIPQEQLNNLHKQILESMREFRQKFYNKSERQLSFQQQVKKRPKQFRDSVKLKSNRQSKGIEMIASLRKKALEMQKMKQIFVWPKLKSSEFMHHTDNVQKTHSHQLATNNNFKMTYKSYLNQINFQVKCRNQKEDLQLVNSSHLRRKNSRIKSKLDKKDREKISIKELNNPSKLTKLFQEQKILKLQEDFD